MSGNGQKILSDAEIDNISKKVGQLSEAVQKASESSSSIIDGTLGSKLMSSYETSSAQNKKNVSQLRSIMGYFMKYSKIIDGMVEQTSKHLATQKSYVEGNMTK